MTLPQTEDSLPNILRLKGLRNVSGKRKVAPGLELLEALDDTDQDVSGTSAPMLPTDNIPELDNEGNVSTQSYDVRANKVIAPNEMPQEQEQDNMWTRFGRALAMNSSMGRIPSSQDVTPQEPPIETRQVDVAEGIPDVSASQEEAQGMSPPARTKGWDPIGDYFSPQKNREMSKSNELLLKDAALRAKERPGMYRDKTLDKEAMDKAQENPFEIAVYGATDAFANQPELVGKLEQYTGIDFDEKTKELTEKSEKVLDDLEKNTNEVEASRDQQMIELKKRILTNKATDADKFYIGLALLMPLIIGGIFGKEAALGALGGASKGFADVLTNREDNIRKDEKTLMDLNDLKAELGIKRGNIELERLKLPSAVKKSLGENPFQDLVGMDIATITNPETGEVVAQGPQVYPDMVANLKYYNTDKKREKMTEMASKLQEEKSALQIANEATKDVIHAAMQLKDPDLFAKILSVGLSEGVDGAGVSLGANSVKKLFKNSLAPTIKDENGRDVNAALYLDAKLEQIKDAYRRNEQMKALTNTVSNHMGSMAENPLYSGLKPEDLVTQMMILRDRAQQFFVNRVKNQGFFAEPITQTFGAQNRDLYNKLNKKERKKIVKEDKKPFYVEE